MHGNKVCSWLLCPPQLENQEEFFLSFPKAQHIISSHKYKQTWNRKQEITFIRFKEDREGEFLKCSWTNRDDKFTKAYQTQGFKVTKVTYYDYDSKTEPGSHFAKNQFPNKACPSLRYHPSALSEDAPRETFSRDVCRRNQGIPHSQVRRWLNMSKRWRTESQNNSLGFCYLAMKTLTGTFLASSTILHTSSLRDGSSLCLQWTQAESLTGRCLWPSPFSRPAMSTAQWGRGSR